MWYEIIQVWKKKNVICEQALLVNLSIALS